MSAPPALRVEWRKMTKQEYTDVAADIYQCFDQLMRPLSMWHCRKTTICWKNRRMESQSLSLSQSDQNCCYSNCY